MNFETQAHGVGTKSVIFMRAALCWQGVAGRVYTNDYSYRDSLSV